MTHDVVGRGVGPAVTRAQQHGQGFPGAFDAVVYERAQRVEAVAPSNVGAASSERGDQVRVDIQDHDPVEVGVGDLGGR